MFNSEKALELLSWEACPQNRDYSTCTIWMLKPDVCVDCWRYYFSTIINTKERRKHRRIRLRCN